MSDPLTALVTEIINWFRTAPPPPVVMYPETAQDGGHPVIPPNADPKFFTPKYPQLGAVDLPTPEHPDHDWLTATKQGKFIPYIGDEPHGMEIDVDPSRIPVNDIDLIAARGHGFGRPVGEILANPVPVYTVDIPPLFGIERKFSTNVFTLQTGVATLIAAKRPERSALRLSVSAAVSVGQSPEQVLSGVGFILPANVIFSMNVNQAVYAVATTGTPTVSVYEEFTVAEGSKRL